MSDTVASYYNSKNPPEAPDTGWKGPHSGYYGGQFDWKGLPGVNNHAPDAPVLVNTDALKQFAENLRWLITPLQQAKGRIEDVKLAPGGFFDAHELLTRVIGAGDGQAIQPTTLTFLQNAIQAVTIAADELDQLASRYKTAEELNAATGKDLAQTIEDAKTYIGAAVGGASTTAS
jgi:hypothetical protein